MGLVSGYTIRFMQDQPQRECARKIAILADVQAAMAALIAIHNDEVTALLDEDFGRGTQGDTPNGP
jgi:hypothetical protein